MSRNQIGNCVIILAFLVSSPLDACTKCENDFEFAQFLDLPIDDLDELKFLGENKVAVEARFDINKHGSPINVKIIDTSPAIQDFDRLIEIISKAKFMIYRVDCMQSKPMKTKRMSYTFLLNSRGT